MNQRHNLEVFFEIVSAVIWMQTSLKQSCWYPRNSAQPIVIVISVHAV